MQTLLGISKISDSKGHGDTAEAGAGGRYLLTIAADGKYARHPGIAGQVIHAAPQHILTKIHGKYPAARRLSGQFKGKGQRPGAEIQDITVGTTL